MDELNEILQMKDFEAAKKRLAAWAEAHPEFLDNLAEAAKQFAEALNELIGQIQQVVSSFIDSIVRIFSRVDWDHVYQIFEEIEQTKLDNYYTLPLVC